MSRGLRMVVALGGNALLRRGQPLSELQQQANIRQCSLPLASLVAAGHQLLLTHGNGPQSGYLALLQGAEWELDAIDAETQGMIGYMLELELRNALLQLSVTSPLCSLLTQVQVSPQDPAFTHPSKPIGPFYDAVPPALAHLPFLSLPDGKRRRLVASPLPQSVVELSTLRLLLQHHHLVVCGGGGGIPVVRTPEGYQGVAAVIDKDRTSALMAAQLDCDALIILTDQTHLYEDFGSPQARPVPQVDVQSLSSDWIEQFPAGSMRPKVEACVEFVKQRPQAFAAIGSIDQVENILNQKSGTRFVSANKT